MTVKEKKQLWKGELADLLQNKQCKLMAENLKASNHNYKNKQKKNLETFSGPAPLTINQVL